MAADSSSRRTTGPRRLADDAAPTAVSDGTPRRAAVPSGQERGGMGSAMGWTVLGAILPGLGLWRSGRRVLGSVVLAVAILLVGGLAGLAITQRSSLVMVATNPRVLQWTALALLVLAIVWVAVIGASHLALRPAGSTIGQRTAGAVLVGGLSFIVAAPLALGANVAYTASTLVQNVFDTTDDGSRSETVPTINAVDPWADKDRLNILILGGDSGTGRSTKAGMRADSVIVASIDTHTAVGTLFSLPRQTARMPFPKDSKLSQVFPHGWYNPGNPKDQNYWLSAMYRLAPPMVPKGTFGTTKYLPEDIMKVSVGEALGLDIDYFVTINMDGFKDIINALDGVTLNVNAPIPIGGDTDRNILPTDWIETGPNQHFGGRLALWYARGRWGYDDYSRMSRQRCVINAVLKQANPQNVLVNFEKLATAGEKTVSTDLPDTMVGPMLDLATRAQDKKLRSIVFINGKDGFSTLTPNWTTVRKQVKKALAESAQSNTETTPSVAVSTPSTSPAGSSSPSPKPTKSTKPKSDDLDDECGYHPTGKIPKGYPGTRDDPQGYRQGR
ncbi:MAG: LCP family protein [Propionicimonas sp.]|nr:LCP family protein [Propionicimonas sp.]